MSLWNIFFLPFFSARKYQINPTGHRPGSPVSTDSNMSMAAVNRRPPKKQKQHNAGHPGNQRRDPYNEGTEICRSNVDSNINNFFYQKDEYSLNYL